MSHNYRHSNFCAHGFSLIEVMVGMVIGLIGIIVMMQIFALTGGNNRTTAGDDDAHNSAAIALNGLQREIRMGGHGITDLRVLGCDVTLRAGIIIKMAPVIINPVTAGTVLGVDPGDANTDTLQVIYGNYGGSMQGDRAVAAGGSSYEPTTPGSYSVGDYIISAPASAGGLAACTRTLTLEKVRSTVAAAVGPPATPAAISQVDALHAAPQVVSGAAGETIFNLGKNLRVMAYAIRGGNLSVCDFMVNNCSLSTAAFWEPIGDNIVSLRALYGRDTLSAGAPAAYVVNLYDQTLPSFGCGWARTPAINLVLVARSGQYNKNIVTLGSPTWLGMGTAPVDLSGFATWQNYRYKTLETIVPLRNVTWMGQQPTC